MTAKEAAKGTFDLLFESHLPLPIMFTLKTLALYFLVIFSALVVYTNATCADDEEGHCKVFAELCDNTDFAAYTAKCAKTCGKC
ncbi:unnamed protein product [Caenorhabditis sp. 36 PRJEB53466]|nr:unnamed protein product [Caenorhabditis sp. 36 PRJEB53466]